MAITWDKQPSSRVITGTSNVLTLTTASQSTATFSSQTYQIRVATSSAVTACFVKIGNGSISATTSSDMLIGANVVDYHQVTPGQVAAVVGGTAAGIVSITEMS